MNPGFDFSFVEGTLSRRIMFRSLLQTDKIIIDPKSFRYKQKLFRSVNKVDSIQIESRFDPS